MNEKRFSFKYLLEDIIEDIYNNNFEIESSDVCKLKEIFWRPFSVGKNRPAVSLCFYRGRVRSARPGQCEKRR